MHILRNSSTMRPLSPSAKTPHGRLERSGNPTSPRRTRPHGQQQLRVACRSRRTGGSRPQLSRFGAAFRVRSSHRALRKAEFWQEAILKIVHHFLLGFESSIGCLSFDWRLESRQKIKNSSWVFSFRHFWVIIRRFLSEKIGGSSKGSQFIDQSLYTWKLFA